MKKIILKDPIHVTKSFLPPINEYVKEISSIWETHWLTNNGKLHNELEKLIKEYLNVSYATLFSNGTLALELAIEALDLNGEIITTPFTFAATTHAISRNSIKPVFCDIEPNTFNIDTKKLEALITDKTTAIIPVHVFGNPCNLEELDKIANKYNLKLIYDAAHAFGVKVNGTPIGGYGDISMFSMHATKVFHSIEGGFLTYNTPELTNKLQLLKNFGISGPENVELIGTNAKLNEFQSAMGIVNLRYIDMEIQKRALVAKKYRKNLKHIKGIKVLDDIDGITHNYSYFPIIIEDDYELDRNTLHQRLIDKKVFTRKYFFPLCSNILPYRELESSKNLYVANEIGNRILTLPIYGSLSEEEVDYISYLIERKGL